MERSFKAALAEHASRLRSTEERCDSFQRKLTNIHDRVAGVETSLKIVKKAVCAEKGGTLGKDGFISSADLASDVLSIFEALTHIGQELKLTPRPAAKVAAVPTAAPKSGGGGAQLKKTAPRPVLKKAQPTPTREEVKAAWGDDTPDEPDGSPAPPDFASEEPESESVETKHELPTAPQPEPEPEPDGVVLADDWMTAVSEQNATSAQAIKLSAIGMASRGVDAMLAEADEAGIKYDISNIYDTDGNHTPAFKARSIEWMHEGWYACCRDLTAPGAFSEGPGINTHGARFVQLWAALVEK
jgi:hypothetical protein